MVKKIVVISLGGSIIIPEKINLKVLKEFRRIIKKNNKKYKFIIVCGGGKTARNYIKGLEDEIINDKEHLQCMLGIASTRLNARFMNYFFQKPSNERMPAEIKEIEDLLKIHDVVFCGGLRYKKGETSDSNAARLAKHFNTDFINLTDIAGLYDKDPKKYKNPIYIPEISSKEFYKRIKKIRFKPGQHFILDKNAAKIIKKYHITTYLLGPDMKNLDNLLNNRHFVGSIIESQS